MFQQGDIIAVDFPFTDGEGKKIRPALILSNEKVNTSGDLIIVMISSSNSFPDLSIGIDNAFLSHPLPKQSFLRCHRVHVLNNSLIRHKVSHANAELLDSVRKKIISLIS